MGCRSERYNQIKSSVINSIKKLQLKNNIMKIVEEDNNENVYIVNFYGNNPSEVIALING
jgi:hypothetical protein